VRPTATQISSDEASASSLIVRSWHRRCFQVHKRRAALSLVGERLIVRQLLNGELHLVCRNKKPIWSELPPPWPQTKASPDQSAPASVGRVCRMATWRRFAIATVRHSWRAAHGVAGLQKTRSVGQNNKARTRAVSQLGMDALPKSLGTVKMEEQ